jgi:hypothetical protein
MAKKKGRKRDIPFCADPENRVLVTTREGSFWRKKRMKGKLNASFAKNVDLSKISGPAARNVVGKLRPYFRGIDTGRITLRISNALRNGLKEKGEMRLGALEGAEMQREHPLDRLLLAPYEVIEESSTVTISINIRNHCVKKQNRLATHFYFEAFMLCGDPATATSLRVETTESKLYAFGEEPDEKCELRLSLPEGDVSWMALLKVSCLEGNEMAHHPMHYAMKVVKGS